MKRYCLITVLIILIGSILSCTHTKEQTHLLSNSLPGVWELRGATGGMRVPDPNDYKPGNGNIWKFTDNHFERILNDSIYNSGSYTVANTGVDINTGRKISQFVFNGTPAESFEIKSGTLNIYYGAIAFDGTIDHFVKIADVH